MSRLHKRYQVGIHFRTLNCFSLSAWLTPHMPVQSTIIVHPFFISLFCTDTCSHNSIWCASREITCILPCLTQCYKQPLEKIPNTNLHVLLKALLWAHSNKHTWSWAISERGLQGKWAFQYYEKQAVTADQGFGFLKGREETQKEQVKKQRLITTIILKYKNSMSTLAL